MRLPQFVDITAHERFMKGCIRTTSSCSNLAPVVDMCAGLGSELVLSRL